MVCVTVSEIERKRDDVWMCDYSFTFGVVSVCMCEFYPLVSFCFGFHLLGY